MEYFEDKKEVEARGHVVIKTGEKDGTTLNADKAIYNQATNIIRLFGNVMLKKDGSTIFGEFMCIDLNEENVLVDEPTGKIGSLTISAQEGYAWANELQLINGSVQMAQEVEMMLQTKGFGSYDHTLFDKELAELKLQKKRSMPLKIKTREIKIKSERDHEVVILKDAEIYYNKIKVAKVDKAELLSNKTFNYVETSSPEVGMLRGFGTYAALGFTTEVPFGGSLKLLPALVIDDGLGIGLIGRYRSEKNFFEAGYATSSKNLVMQGKYNFSKDLYIDYGRNAYFDEWFMGRRMPGYMAQLVYDKKHRLEDIKADFRHRFTGGFVSEYNESDSSLSDGTMRLRWQGEIRKDLYSKRDLEQDLFFGASVYTQAGATVYGTGDTQALVRFGPEIRTRVKNWGSRIGYGIAGVHGQSPFEFDNYLYGKQYITIDENIKLGKYLAIGYRGTVSLLRDNPNKDFLTENRIYAIIGPEDAKVGFSYDSYRQRAVIDLMVLVGSDNTKMSYDKLSVENPESTGKKANAFENFKFYKTGVPKEDMPEDEQLDL